MPEFKLPDLGEGVTEAEIDKWLVKEGQTIAEDDPLVEVITDKATAEIPSPFGGVVARLHVKEGEVVPVGTTLITVLRGSDLAGAPRVDRGHGPPPPPPGAPSQSAGQPEASPQPEVATQDVEPPVRPQPDVAPAVVTEEQPGRGGRQPNGVKAMPPVRKLARNLGVDLSEVRGSGPSGRILRGDVEQHAQSGRRDPGGPSVGAPPAAAIPSSPDQTRVPYKGIRRKIGERMTHAHLVVPPVTHVEECDVTELDATRRLANERAPEAPKLTFMPFIVKAVVTALKDHPAMNASLDETTNEIVQHGRYDIGVAVDTPAGLTVPVVRDADKKRLREIAADIARLAEGARAGTLGADDFRDPTFTVTSPGPFGGLLATPIVFHPQSAILGVHRATERPVVRDGQIVVRLVMNMSVTFDHRILDGMTAARWILDVVKLLEHPAVLALEA